MVASLVVCHWMWHLQARNRLHELCLLLHVSLALVSLVGSSPSRVQHEVNVFPVHDGLADLGPQRQPNS